MSTTAVPFWSSAARERQIAALVMLARRDVGADYCSKIYVTDASYWGLGVLEKEVKQEEVREHLDFSERWRYSKSEEGKVSVRDDDFGDVTVRGPAPPVSENLLGGRWSRVCSKSWRAATGRPQVHLEARSFVYVIKHLARNTANSGKRHLVLGDAMAVILGLCKGRSSSVALGGPSRLWAAYALGSDLYVGTRWIPSERNAADGASRNLAGNTATGIRHVEARSRGGDGACRMSVGSSWEEAWRGSAPSIKGPTAAPPGLERASSVGAFRDGAAKNPHRSGDGASASGGWRGNRRSWNRGLSRH